jgi:SAM-dependent methyltransferase
MDWAPFIWGAYVLGAFDAPPPLNTGGGFAFRGSSAKMELPYSNMQVQHWNPGATMPLVLPIQNFCNTDDERVYANIRVNARTCRRWLHQQPAHGRVAVIVGSGPSMKESVAEIERWREQQDADIFALNGAAKFLADKRVVVDYQVILDAREESAGLVDQRALQHLFCSQVHPQTLARGGADTILWHLAYEKTEEQFQDDEIDEDYEPTGYKVWNVPGPYTQIGGGITVGISALFVAYALGYRTFRLYGYDSSAAEDKTTHAFRQPMNDGEPMCWTKFNRKDYLASFTMKLQAEHFPQQAGYLQALGCAITVHGTGLLPDIWNSAGISEVEKYRQVWEEPAYRNHSPGEEHAAEFVQMCEVRPYHKVLDLGCGTGRGGAKIFALADCNVTLLDFAVNCLDKPIQKLLGIWQSIGRFRFIEADLTQPIPAQGDYGFCCDVLEHIPPADVDKVIRNCLAAAPTVYFNISTVPDEMGQLITQRLHLSVHPFEWWKETFKRLGYAVRFAEERVGAAVFLVSVP